MSLFKRPDSSIWWIKFNHNGKRIQKSSGTTNRRAAQEIEAAIRLELAKGAVGIDTPTEAPTLEAFSARFLAHVEVECANKPKTIRFYRQRTAALLQSTMSKLRLDAITADHITAYKKANLNSIATCNRDLATLRRMFNLALEWNVINKAAKVKLSAGEGKRDFVLSLEDEAKYLTASSSLLHRVAVIMLDCGFRPEEIYRLRHEQCRDGSITILAGKRDGSRRSIEMTDRVIEAIGKGFGLVFPSDETAEGHITRDTIKKQHEAAIKASGVPRFVPYSLRHTCLTRWAIGGMDVATLQYLAGHKSIATSMGYIHLAATDAQTRLRQVRKVATFLATDETKKTS